MAIREPIVQTRAAPIRRGVQLFRPPDVFTGGEAGLALTVEESVLQGRIWQDSAGTTRANKIDDPVGRVDDISGDGNNLTQSTATARPLLKQTAGGRWHLEFDETDDEYTVTLPDITDGTVVLIGVDGIWIDDAFNHSAGTWTLGYNSGDNNYTGGPAGILTTVGGLLGVTVLDRQLTAAERQAVIDYGLSVGAPGEITLGTEYLGTPIYDGYGSNTVSAPDEDGFVTVDYVDNGAGALCRPENLPPIDVPALWVVDTRPSAETTVRVRFYNGATYVAQPPLIDPGVLQRNRAIVSREGSSAITNVSNFGAGNPQYETRLVSVRKLVMP